MSSIFCSLVYFSLKLAIIGKETKKDPNTVKTGMAKMKADGSKTLNDALPIVGVITLVMAFFQWAFYLQAFENLSTQLRLLFRSISDTIGFFALFFIMLFLFYLGYLQLGILWDDGDNFSSDYDTHFNDYPMVDPGIVSIIAQLRTAFGDVQPPGYDYWAARYNEGDVGISTFYIYFTWVTWFIQFFIMVILMLNLLISIVAESYTYIQENQKLTKARGLMRLNLDAAIDGDQTGDMNDPINTILFCTKTREIEES